VRPAFRKLEGESIGGGEQPQILRRCAPQDDASVGGRDLSCDLNLVGESIGGGEQPQILRRCAPQDDAWVGGRDLYRVTCI